MVYTVRGYCDKKALAEIKVYSMDAKCGSMTTANQEKSREKHHKNKSALISHYAPATSLKVGVLQVY